MFGLAFCRVWVSFFSSSISIELGLIFEFVSGFMFWFKFEFGVSRICVFPLITIRSFLSLNSLGPGIILSSRLIFKVEFVFLGFGLFKVVLVRVLRGLDSSWACVQEK